MTRPTDAPTLYDEAPEPTADAPASPHRGCPPDLSTPSPGPGRRMAIALGLLLAIWIVLMFARQVGEGPRPQAALTALLCRRAGRRRRR